MTPTFDAICRAAEIVATHLDPSPLLSHPLLEADLGGPVVVKHENALPTSSFKVRGGIHLVAGLSDADRRAGLVTVSTGNHAQSVAYAARLAETTATVVMPTSAPEVKAAAVEALGARVVRFGPTMVEAATRARELAAEGARFVSPAEETIILGHGTLYLELFTARPDLACVVVPVGSGTGAAGACLVRDAVAPDCRVVGVQSAAAPAAWESWNAGQLRDAPCRTRVSGLATGCGFALPQSVIAGRLDDFVLVDDDQIDDAARLLAHRAHTLAEGAGAASLAGLRAIDRPEGPASVVVTGGNASAEELAALCRPPSESTDRSLSRSRTAS